MKKMVAVLVALVATLALRAETETVGGYTWTYRVNSDGTVKIGNHSQCAFGTFPGGALLWIGLGVGSVALLAVICAGAWWVFRRIRKAGAKSCF